MLHNKRLLLRSWRTCGKQDYKIETHSLNNGQAPRQQYLVSVGCYDSPTETFHTSSIHHTETSSSLETVSNRMVLTPSPFAEMSLLTYMTRAEMSQYCTRHQQSANLCALFFRYQCSSTVTCIKHHQFYIFVMAFSKANKYFLTFM
jgi:hypothetical protein